jgi:hypothetical protein
VANFRFLLAVALVCAGLTAVAGDTPPAAPSNLSASAGMQDGFVVFNLSWTDNASDETGFEIQSSSDGGATWSDAGSVEANSSAAVIYVFPGAEFTYHVRAYNEHGNSDFSNQILIGAPPDAPPSFSASAVSATEISLSWGAPSASITGYQVWTDNGYPGSSGQSFGVGPEVTFYSHTGLYPLTQYSYSLVAINAWGQSQPMSVSASTPDLPPPPPPDPPSAPYCLSASASGSSVGLTWMDGSSNETGFVIERSTDGMNFGSCGWAYPDTSYYTDYSVSSGNWYYYRVKATGDAGDSDYSNVSSVYFQSQNNPPVVSDVFISATQYLPVTFSLNASDPENDPLTYWVGSSGYGSLSGTPPTLTYTSSYAGCESISYSASDGNSTSYGTIWVTIQSYPVPTASDASVTVLENSSANFQVDIAGGNGSLFTGISSYPSNGTASISGANASYTPTAGFYGADSFQYWVCDGYWSTYATVYITVPENYPPVVDNPTVSVDENSSVTITLTATDPEAGSVSLTGYSTPAYGSLSVSGWQATYTPNTGWYGSDSFTYTVSDGCSTATGTVTIHVQQIPPPEAADDYYTVESGTTLTVPAATGVLDNDYDPNAYSLTASLGTGPSHGTLSFNADGSFSYTPTEPTVWNDDFTYSVSNGVQTDQATVYISIQDTIPPMISDVCPADSSTTYLKRPTVSANISDTGSGVEWSLLHVYVDGTDQVYVEGAEIPVTVTDGGFTAAPTADLSAGTHTVEIFVEDVAGNIVRTYSQFTILADTTPPTISNLYPAISAIVYSSSPIIQAKIVDAQSGVNWASLEMTLNGDPVAPDIREDGFIFLEWPELVDGTNTVTIYVEDNVGNPAEADWSFTHPVDVDFPTVSNLSPADGSTITTAQPTISADITAGTTPLDWSTLSVFVDYAKVDVTLTQTGFTYSPAYVNIGYHTVNVCISDLSGYPADTEWFFDYAPDTGVFAFSNLRPLDGGTLYNTLRPAISGDFVDTYGTPEWYVINVYVDGTEIPASWSTSHFSAAPGSDLAPGVHTVTVDIEDSFELTAEIQWQFTTAVDTTPPAIDFLAPENGATIYDTDYPTIYAYFSDAGSGIDAYLTELYIDGVLLGGIGVSDTTAATYADPQPAGEHSVTIIVYDKAGNSATQTNTFTVVTMPDLEVIIWPSYGELPLPWVAGAYLTQGVGQTPVDVTEFCSIEWTGGPVSGSGPTYIIPTGTPVGDYTITATATYTTNGVGGRSLARVRSFGAGTTLTASTTQSVSIPAPNGGGQTGTQGQQPSPGFNPPPKPKPGMPPAAAGILQTPSVNDGIWVKCVYQMPSDPMHKYLQFVTIKVNVKGKTYITNHDAQINMESYKNDLWQGDGLPSDKHGFKLSLLTDLYRQLDSAVKLKWPGSLLVDVNFSVEMEFRVFDLGICDGKNWVQVYSGEKDANGNVVWTKDPPEPGQQASPDAPNQPPPPNRKLIMTVTNSWGGTMASETEVNVNDAKTNVPNKYAPAAP